MFHFCLFLFILFYKKLEIWLPIFFLRFSMVFFLIKVFKTFIKKKQRFLFNYGRCQPSAIISYLLVSYPYRCFYQLSVYTNNSGFIYITCFFFRIIRSRLSLPLLPSRNYCSNDFSIAIYDLFIQVSLVEHLLWFGTITNHLLDYFHVELLLS